MKYPVLPEKLDERRKLLIADIKKIQILRKAGLSLRAIAKQFGVSKNTVQYHTDDIFREKTNKKRYQRIKAMCEARPEFKKKHEEAKVKSYVEGYRKFPDRALYKGKETYKWKKKKYHANTDFKEKTKQQARAKYYRDRAKPGHWERRRWIVT